ncbi:MAG: hypothetical protein II817_01325 [Bacteroidales bacterium]|nr:hypothetical protein [Bacteroidales bacterium]
MYGVESIFHWFKAGVAAIEGDEDKMLKEIIEAKISMIPPGPFGDLGD